MLRENFGSDGQGNVVELITLKNAKGTKVKLSTLGAAVVSFIYKDKAGIMRDVVLGYDKAESYLLNGGYLGATVGRCANRISNAKVTISGVEYALEDNDLGNNLHSGSNSVAYKNWEVDKIEEACNRVTFKYLSADLEQGFPGNMTIKVTYQLTEEDALSIIYEGVSDKDTVANFTNHSYFNLAGHDSGYIGKQKIKVHSKAFLPVAPTGSVPTGEIRPVGGTPFDFTEFKEIGKEIEADYDQLRYTAGYDHTFVLENKGKLELAAEAFCDATGIHLYAYTDCPGVQLYAGNYVEKVLGKGGAIYGRRHGFCFETQYYPDSVNNPAFEAPLLKAGEVYTSVTVYKLGLEEV